MKFEKTFDNAVEAYEVSRPNYPCAMYEDIFRYKAIDLNSRVIEIGIGTGKATEPVLKTGCQLTAIEPGEQLAAYATEKFREYPNFQMKNTMFQDFSAPNDSYDLIYAATAFHWIPEEYGYPRVFELLKQNGAFARFAYHAGVDESRPEMTDEIQTYYSKYLHQSAPPKDYGDAEAKALADIASKYGFSDIRYCLYHWTKDFSADEYMNLLKTYPNHMGLNPTDRENLFSGIHSAINHHGGTITVYYTLDLQMARKI